MMISTACWFIILVSSLAVDAFPKPTAGRIDLGYRPVRNISRVSERKCEEYTRGTTCKKSYDDIDPSMVEAAELGEFPHMAFIASNESKNVEYICTGSLISPRFVITAARCAKKLVKQVSYVTLGAQSIDPSMDDEATTMQVPIKSIVRHPKYKPHQSRKIYNDIVLLELASEVTFNANIRPACLWTKEQTAEHALISTIDNEDSDPRELVMQKVSVTMSDINVCNSLYKNRNRWNHGFDETQLCGQEATGNDLICKSTRGSPLQIISNSKTGCALHVIGLTVFKPTDCTIKPTIFTRISSYVDWIESVVWPAE